MTDPILAVQAALYTRLSAELSCPVYDAVPPEAALPYVTLDREFTRNTSPISGRRRQDRLIYLAVWSQYQGQAEVKRLLAEISAALDGRPLELGTGRAVAVRVQQMAAQREPDGITYQGSATVRVLTTD